MKPINPTTLGLAIPLLLTASSGCLGVALTGWWEPTLVWALAAVVSFLGAVLLVFFGWMLPQLLKGRESHVDPEEIEPDLRPEDKREHLLDYACSKAMQRLREFDDTARLNIMEVTETGPDDTKSLDIIYDLYVDDDHPDKMMKMGYTQGVCGDAARKGESCFADISDPTRPTFGLTAEQLKKTEHVTFVISMPIRKAVTGPDGKRNLTDEVIGVVNIDSGKPHPEDFYKSQMIEGESLLRRQLTALREISEYCSNLLS